MNCHLRSLSGPKFTKMFTQVLFHQKKTSSAHSHFKSTPPKANVTMENQPFEDVSPIKNGFRGGGNNLPNFGGLGGLGRKFLWFFHRFDTPNLAINLFDARTQKKQPKKKTRKDTHLTKKT